MMSAHVEQLIKKLNQIAANQAAVADQETRAALVSEHLRKFWSPLMKQKMTEYAGRGQGELSVDAYLAVKRLRAHLHFPVLPDTRSLRGN